MKLLIFLLSFLVLNINTGVNKSLFSFLQWCLGPFLSTDRKLENKNGKWNLEKGKLTIGKFDIEHLKFKIIKYLFSIPIIKKILIQLLSNDYVIQ